MRVGKSAGRMNPGVALVLACFGLLVLVLSMRGCLLSPPWHNWDFFWSTGRFGGGSLVGIWGLIQIALAIWVGIDANSRGSHGWLWGLLVLVTPVIGLVVYLIVVSGMAQGSTNAVFAGTSGPCPSCGQPVRHDFRVCPYCGDQRVCKNCSKPLEPGWKLCPYCGQTTATQPTPQ